MIDNYVMYYVVHVCIAACMVRVMVTGLTYGQDKVLVCELDRPMVGLRLGAVRLWQVWFGCLHVHWV